MKDIENIEEWYRNELNNYNVEPDKNVWDSLSEDLDASTPLTDENISDWYKKEVSKLEERPDYTVWEKLSTKLDTASVWDKLAVSLDRYEQLIWWRNVAIKGSAIFLLFFSSYLAYDNYYVEDNSLALNNTPSSKDRINSSNNTVSTKSSNNNLENINSTSKKNGSFSELNGQDEDSYNNYGANNSIKNDNISHKKTSSEEKIKGAIKNAKATLTSKGSTTINHNKNNTLYASKEEIANYNPISINNLNSLKTNDKRTIFTDINRHQLTERDISHFYYKGGFLVKKDKNKIIFNKKRFSSHSNYGVYSRKLYLGFNVGLKKQDMITKLKENTPLANYSQNSLLDFGTNFGGTIGFIISDKLNIESNINIHSTSGYKRSFNAEGISYQENLNLNYSNITLLAKKMNSRSTYDNRIYSTNFIGGVYASYLRSATSDANGISQKLDEYNKTDFGIVLGIEQDRYITKTLIITPGIRYNQGLTNIANDNSSFESSRNFSFEFNLGVKYIFLKSGR